MSTDVRVRRGDWMQVYTGGQFWPLDPRAEDVHIEDIAHALSMICRYQGHTSRFYSVAEHCLLVAQAMATYGAHNDLILRALLHDAAEAYICDVVRPLKRCLAGYAEAEERIEQVIWERFGLPLYEVGLVKTIDNLILYDEAKALMGVHCIAWHEQFSPGLGVEIVGLAPAEAEAAFLKAFHRLSPPMTAAADACPVTGTGMDG